MRHSARMLAGGFAVAALLVAAGGMSDARAEDAAFTISIKDHRFSPAEITVPAGKPFALTIRNLDPTPEEFESRTLRVERVIPGSGATTFRMRALNAGRYRFFGEFHEDTAEGYVIAK